MINASHMRKQGGKSSLVQGIARWGDGRDAGKHPPVLRAAPTRKDYPVPNVNSAEDGERETPF